jgi:hypothetical protein
MLVTLGPSAMILDLNMLLIHEDNYFVILPASCIYTSLSGTRSPEVTAIGITGGDGYDVRITCVHGVLMLCSGALLKGAP